MITLALASALAFTGHASFADDAPLMLQHPTLSATHIAFAFGGDIWTVDRNGGAARRLTSSPGQESEPWFSPDGKSIAFTGSYDGNVDVYVVSAAGGNPKRLTYNPEGDSAQGWTNDGSKILLSSTRARPHGVPALYTVTLTGDLPELLPFPEGTAGSFSPESDRIAYVPKTHWQAAWKRYRGGQTYPIWIARLSDSAVEEIPRNNTNDYNPMWVGGKVYFISDRNGPVTLFSYDLTAKKVTQCFPNTGLDIKSADAGPGGIAYEQFGGIWIYDTASGKQTKVPITVQGDFQETRERFLDVSDAISSGAISPNGLRVAVEARGEIFSAPVGKGNTRNLTNSSGAADRSPAWSPDGKWIAYFSDESGEYKLMLVNSMNADEKKSFEPGDAPSFYYSTKFSPDGNYVSYTDKKLNLWIQNIVTGRATKIATDMRETPFVRIAYDWSPNSKFIAYSKSIPNYLRAIFIYSVESGESKQITDGMSDAQAPAFDKSGNYLYFVASTDAARGAGWLDMTSLLAPNSLYSGWLVVLRKDLPSPLAPQSDEEGVAPPDQKPDTGEMRIDFDGIAQRTILIPLPAKNYVSMAAGTPGTVFALGADPVADVGQQPATTLYKFDLGARMTMPFARGVGGFEISTNGAHILILGAGGVQVVSTAAPPAPGQGAIAPSLPMKLNPLAEWRQMYHEAWRIQRDFMYVSNMHGLKYNEVVARYEPFLINCVSRADLNYLFEEMLGETCLGHTFPGGGDIPGVDGVPSGLLGADYTLENGRYRFSRVFNGENWNPGLRAPLAQPGLNIVAGEYLLAVNGKDITSKDNIFQVFENLTGKQVKIRVGPNASSHESREVIVVPTASETGLRGIAWIEDNRRKVAEMTGGKAGYVYLPDTGLGGWTNFNRYFFSQIDKEGMVVDERYNGGGTVADYFVDWLTRPLRSYWATREGAGMRSPVGTVLGPKVMITNEYAGSGGDYLPWLFKRAKAGTIVGTRTWGGLVGIYDYPTLLDGGQVQAPRVAIFDTDGKWIVENWGVDPDIEVIQDPALWRRGHDPQLERAVQELLKLMAKEPKRTVQHDPYPDKTKVGTGRGG